VIEYDRNNWWGTVLSFRGTVLPNMLGRVGALTLFTLGLCLIDDFLSRKYGVSLPALDQLGHTVLGVSLGLLIVFRTSSSNGRYWDGRTYWGALINGSRNLARIGAVYAPPAEPLANLITAYAISVRENLRGHRDFQSLERLIPPVLVHQMVTANNPPSLVAAAISAWIHQRMAEGHIDTQQAMHMEYVLGTMVDNQGGCERIQRTPLPFVYAALIKQILLVYLVTLPLVLIAKMGFAAPLVVAVLSFGLLGIEEAGIEIEAPFGMDPNSLPLEQLCATIARDTATLCASSGHSSSG
jgi:ion channel-forming bestrophin family protein